MSFSEIKNIVQNSSTLNRVLDDINDGKNVFIKGLTGSLKAIFLSILFDQKRVPIFFITGEDEQEEVLREDLEFLIGSEQVCHIPKISELARDGVIVDSARKGQLLSALERLLEKKNLVTIVSAKNLPLRFPAPGWILKQRLVIQSGTEYRFDLLKERLIELGFSRETLVENWGEMSVRGGIIDVYPFSSDSPYRVEFFGDSIESIRIFDPATQRSIKHVSELIIYPQNPEQQNQVDDVPFVSLFDYLADDSIIFIDEMELIKKDVEEFLHFTGQFIDEGKSDENAIHSNKYLDWDDLKSLFDFFTTIHHNTLSENSKSGYYDFSSHAQESLRGNLPLLKNKIEFFVQKKSAINDQPWKVFFLCDTSDQIERMDEILTEAGISSDEVAVRNFGINQGFVFPEVGLVVFTDNQFYGRPLRWRKRKKVHRGLTLQQLNTLNIGDYVVHEDHGIGKYQGLKKITVQGNERECLSIVYQDGDYLYVPLERMDRVQKYSAKEGVVPILSKLGSKDWDRLKKKTKKRVKEIARELIQLYARRKAQKGFAFSKDTLWQKELEASFEYEDTPDQHQATEQVKQDMENESPMDRLVCGDVGFGKTEVAIRAAFKAVHDNKQVAVLVPTTILALQHYNLFKERIRNFPIKVEMLSRFRTTAEQKQIVEWLKQGRVDIVIGTHRLLSKDVQFKDLGLLIIDEEHRFGVQNKERLKQQHVNVDVLSMSATPIPRTLNMGLLGIRDMSLIVTPPKDRLPIYTEVTAFDQELIRMVILKEIQRGGQIFFVHNRVQSIETVANMLRRLVPEVTFVVAHGQMDERQLEKVMWNFAMRKYQCLVSTMIIGSGVDIPNVNTLIVNRADRFGLSQLYQLRGRVGRSNQLAYAYLLVPPLHLLNRNALKRLQIIEEFTELGSGFNIAMRDLEIRGAGNIFGAEQTGHIVALGYELYMKIIEEAIAEIKLESEGKPVPEDAKKEETRVEINRDAFIPDEYVDQPELKVDIYRRLANERDLSIISQIKDEIKDRFGAPPQPVINLFNLVELKILGNLLGFKLVKVFDHTLYSYFLKDIATSADRELIRNKVCVITQKAKGAFYFIQNGKDEFGIRVDIPKSEKDPVEYSKLFLNQLA